MLLRWNKLIKYNSSYKSYHIERRLSTIRLQKCAGVKRRRGCELCGLGSYDAGAKGHERELCVFETLHAKGDAYHGDAQDQPDGDGFNAKGKTAKYEPNDVQREGDDAAAKVHILAKGHAHEPRELKTLHAPRNADDGDAPKKPRERPAQPKPKACKYKPQNIS